MLTGLAPLAALLVLLVAPAPPASAQSSAILPDSDLKALTASLRTYLEARSEGRDLLAPRQALAAELARLRKSDDGKQRDARMAWALAVRVGLSVALFLFILLAWKMGWISPTGIPTGR